MQIEEEKRGEELFFFFKNLKLREISGERVVVVESSAQRLLLLPQDQDAVAGKSARRMFEGWR